MKLTRDLVTIVLLISALKISYAESKLTNQIDYYKPAHEFTLRAPAVPLILSDPNFSIWSPFDQLYQGNSQHWTGTDHPIIGALRVDGKTYRFMGKDKPALQSVIPAEDGKYWTASYTFDKPAGDWNSVSFDDSQWRRGEAAFGTSDMPRVKTRWNTKNIWVRRAFNIDDDLSREQLVLMYSHDDIFELYLNGERLVKTDYSWKNDVELVLSEAQRKKLRKGKNVIAAHCQNQTGGAYVDFNLYKRKNQKGFDEEAIQKAVNVLPTQTFYTFACGPVDLDVVFTAPLLPEDLDLVSTPINYISYRVRSTDKKDHDVQIYFETTPQLAVNDLSQNVVSEYVVNNGKAYLKTGTIDQPYTIRASDGVRIDWGYAYLTSGDGVNTMLNIGDYFGMKNAFIETGKLLSGKSTAPLRSDLDKEIPVLAYSQQLGNVGKEGKDGYLMIGYDDVYAIEYFFERRMAYWKHDGKVDIIQAFERAATDYKSLMEKCRAFDSNLIDVARKTGGDEYAALCALTYRQAVAAHKLITDKQGNLLFLSKENHSGGFINTVDVTYPSAPLFLYYNPDLLKGMLTGIFYYSESGRWNKPYPAHDLGHYPRANGQNYGEDMPVEEAGNMILLTTAISVVEGNANYAKKHWNTLTTWANFLLEKGLDPENQLCTDDFAGHLAHNANLSIKAILGVAGYGKMAEMLGETEIAKRYIREAKEMAKAWVKMAEDGDHYKLAFDRPGSWSQKYNLVWDKLFDMNIFPEGIAEKEIPFYLKRQAEHKYGLPLDSRKDYTKSDWILWTACLSPDNNTFQQFVAPVYRYADETVSRVPISDFHDTNDSKMQNFKARSVVGGYYMKMLFDKLKK
ncbi:MAG: DUF4965 domain-containing protein [Paludibacter sp.]|nr:DUF4965 domain-containing protein [Paludibacter sp.]